MSINILVNGASGKMGSVLCNTLLQSSDFTLCGKSNSTSNLLSNLDNKLDIVVDFTNPSSVYENSLAIIESNVRPVIGTSGLSTKQIKELQSLCQKKQLGGIIAPNFSIGAIMMMKCSKLLAKNFAKAEIVEYHHDKKLDSPSGTATQTAEIIDTTRSQSTNPLTGENFSNNLNTPIHSVRLPGMLAHQSVIFGSLGETLTIKHDSIDRQCFMPGVLFACKQVMSLNQLIYGLDNILE